MFGFLSNRATAAHLALAAVAPLVLCKYFPLGEICAVFVWIAIIVSAWSFLSPAKEEVERSSDARGRFLWSLTIDPFFWMAIVLIAYASVVSLNSGVCLSYDLELKNWKLMPPALGMLPGAVRGAGAADFAAAVLMFSVYAGVTYALDSRQCIYFAILTALIVVADAVFAFASGIGTGAGSAVAYGLWALIAAAGMFSAELSRQRSKELVSALVLTGCLAALLFSFRPAVICIFASALLLLALAFVGFRVRELGFVGVVRGLLMLVVASLAAAALFQWQFGDWEPLLAGWDSAADAVFNRFAFETWKVSPWTGAGVGSFPLVVKLGATAEDWSVIGPMTDFGGNGWRLLLAERGMVGVLALAVSVGTLAFSWCRYTKLRGLARFSPAVSLFPLAVAAVATSMVYDSSAMQAEALVAFAALAAVSVNGGQ